jgi:hypothetical protein
MDCHTIHCYAEEVELWTSLAINIWLILTAISFVAANPRVRLEPLVFHIARAIIWGFIGLCVAGSGVLLGLTFDLPRPFLERVNDTVIAIGVPGGLAYLGFAALKRFAKSHDS